jgi:hypothetical protein
MKSPRPRTIKQKRRENAHTFLKTISNKAKGHTQKRDAAQKSIINIMSNYKRKKDESNNPFIDTLNGLKGVREYSPIVSNSRSRAHSRPKFLNLNQVKKIESIKNQKRILKLTNGHNLNVLGKLKGHYNPKSKKISHRFVKPLKEIPRPNRRTRETPLERTLWK